MPFRPPHDPERYHAALILSVELGREALRTQFESLKEETRQNDSLGRLGVLLVGGALTVGGFLLRENPHVPAPVAILYAIGIFANIAAVGWMTRAGGSGSQAQAFREGPSLEGLASGFSDPEWSDHRLLLSLVSTYPALARRNRAFITRLGRARAAGFGLLLAALFAYLAAGTYIVGRWVYG